MLPLIPITYQVVLHNLKDLSMLLGLFGEWVATPARIFNGHLFALLLLPSLDEEELEEIMVSKVESLIDQKLITFNTNGERAISSSVSFYFYDFVF